MSAFIDARRQDFGVELICRTIGTSASAYYQRKSGERSARDVEDDRLLGVIRHVHADNYEAYGSRRMWKALAREGEDVGRGRVERLMSRNGIVGAKRRGKPWRTTVPAAEPVSVPDLLARDFTASRPNEKWCADFTYLRCWTGVVFLSFVIDVYSRMIVGWQLVGHMRESLVEDALQMAVATRRIDPQQVLIHHSDHGSQYTSQDFTTALREHAIHASLGSVGDAYDNALAESFVDSFKTELIADRVWQARDQLEFAIARWIGWYNQRRLHSSLGDIPPAEFEALHAAQTQLAQAA
ncbi:MAG: IS3 family transposase [Actinobacteria bacterium]|nr:IS3 family transposase [Actinomycetota bacterium]